MGHDGAPRPGRRRRRIGAQPLATLAARPPRMEADPRPARAVAEPRPLEIRWCPPASQHHLCYYSAKAAAPGRPL